MSQERNNREPLETITRPNGKPYHPRKVTSMPLSTHDDDFDGVVVFGTHDVARAQPLADYWVRNEVRHTCVAAKPSLVWWRDSFEYGRRTFVTDEEHGRAGVFFADVFEPLAVSGG